MPRGRRKTLSDTKKAMESKDDTDKEIEFPKSSKSKNSPAANESAEERAEADAEPGDDSAQGRKVTRHGRRRITIDYVD